MWLVSGYLLGIYRDVEFRNRRELATDAAKLVALSVLLLNTSLYLIRAEDVSRAFVLTIGAVDLVFLMVGRWTLVWGGSWWRDKVRTHHHCLIVGTGPAARELAKLIEQSEPLRIAADWICGAGTRTPRRRWTGSRSYPVYSLEQAYDILKNHVVDELLCAVGPDDLERLGAAHRTLPRRRHTHARGPRISSADVSARARREAAPRAAADAGLCARQRICTGRQAPGRRGRVRISAGHSFAGRCWPSPR